MPEVSQVLAVAKALADPTRLRILCALETGDLCISQLVALLELAPSSVSAHGASLVRAGLAETRKHGRWVFLCLPRSVAPSYPRRVLLETLRALADAEPILIDRERLEWIREQPLEVLADRSRE